MEAPTKRQEPDLSVLFEGMGRSGKKGSLLCLSQSLLLTYPKRFINSVPPKEHLEAERWVAQGPGPRMGVKAWPFLGEAFYSGGGACGTGEAAGPKILPVLCMSLWLSAVTGLMGTKSPSSH